MQRERRWCLRKPASLTVKLHCEKEGTTDCAVRDISLEGLFLETQIRPDLASIVEITIVPNAQQQFLHTTQLSAKVMHVDTDGIGIMFHELSIDTVKTMRRLFYS